MVKIQSSSQAEENEGTNMTDITTISIGRTSGFGSVEDSFYEELTVTYDSISYEYKPGMETEFNKSEEWFYRTTRPAFQELFRQAAAAAVEGINRVEEKFVTDIGFTSISVTYADGTVLGRALYFPEDESELKECFNYIQQMVPGGESIPTLLTVREVKKNSALRDFTRSLVQRWKWKDQRPKMPDLPDTLLPPDLPHTLLPPNSPDTLFPPDPPDYPDLSDTLVLPDLPDYPDSSQSDDF